MKNLALLFIITGIIFNAACKKDQPSENFKLLTGSSWQSDSLLANGVDASGPGGILENFAGVAKFNEDYTGSFGIYTGTWRFANNETQIVITTESLAVPLSTKIAELTALSLKITTLYPNLIDPYNPVYIRMTFKAK